MDGTQALMRQFPQPTFHPLEPHFSHVGDFVSTFSEDVPYVAKRLDDVLTVYVAQDDERLVGCKIKGVSTLAKNVLTIVRIHDGTTIRLELLLLNAAGIGAARYYFDVSDLLGKVELPISELQALCSC
jgi:hypothetical protein